MNKLKIHIQILLFALVSFALTGCYSLGTVEIEVIKPAKITIPSNIRKVLIINNSLSFPADSFKNKIQKGLFKLDTSTTQLVASYVNDIINESPRFDTSILINDIYFRKPKDLLQPIEWQNVNKLCTQYNSDALISLEAFGIFDSILRINYYDGYTLTSYKTLALIANSMWRVYLMDEHKVLEKRIYRDTLYFDEINSKKEYFNAIEQSKAIKFFSNEIALNISTKVADRMAPYWLAVQRSFFINGSSEMQQAAKYAYADNWHGATLIWKEMTTNENKRLSAAACYNMALACEVEGKLDIAKKWLEESVMQYNTYTAHEYYKQIQLRINESEKLDKQFGVEE